MNFRFKRKYLFVWAVVLSVSSASLAQNSEIVQSTSSERLQTLYELKILPVQNKIELGKTTVDDLVEK